MVFGKKKKVDELIETPKELPQLPQSPIQNLQQEVTQEVQPQLPQKVVMQTVIELPTRPIREEVVGDTRIVYQTIGELIQENNKLLKEIKQLAEEE